MCSYILCRLSIFLSQYVEKFIMENIQAEQRAWGYQFIKRI